MKSQQKAAAARAAGKLADEIIPIKTKAGDVTEDGTIRPDTTAEGLAGLKPAFDKDGSVTAGTSSPLTDGASAVLRHLGRFRREARPHRARQDQVGRRHGRARPRRWASARSAPARRRWSAPASPPTSSTWWRSTRLSPARRSPASRISASRKRRSTSMAARSRSAIRLGATGARIVGKAAALLARDGGQYALATQCIGGGQGIATVLERA